MKILMPIRIIDNDSGEITAEVNGEEIRGWSYHTPGEQSRKMLMAHEFAEGWFQRDRRESPND